MLINKKFTLAASLTALFIATSANATLPGPYIGGQLGWGDVHQTDDIKHQRGLDLSSTGIAGRLLAGYRFNNFIAAELGWSKFSNATAKAKHSGFDDETVTVKGTVKTDAVDLVAKAMYPIDCGFSVYGKAGIAYVMARASMEAKVHGVKIESDNDSEDKLFPTFGVGINYAINEKVSTDLSWNRIQKTGKSNIKSTDLVAVGLLYNFG